MMPEFLKVLLFANMIVLTPEPVDIEQGLIEFDLSQPISAITKGATLQIDISSMIPEGISGISDTRTWLRKEFEVGFSSASLINTSSGQEIIVNYRGNSAWSEGKVYLLLSSEDGVPPGSCYDKVVIETDVALYDVRVVWKNYSK